LLVSLDDNCTWGGHGERSIRIFAPEETPGATYKILEGGLGVAWGAFRIDSTASTEAERKIVEQEHLALVKSVAQLDAMHELVESWREVERLQRHMTQPGQKDRDVVITGDLSSRAVYPSLDTVRKTAQAVGTITVAGRSPL